MLRVALAAALLLAVPASARSGDLVIQGDRSFAGVRMGAPASALVKRFGRPDSWGPRGTYECVAHWPGLGLRVTVVDLSGDAPCAGVVLGVTATGARWRTALGLRVGEPVARVNRLFPRARHVRDGLAEWRGWWLVTRRACELGGHAPYPALLARERAGGISALVIAMQACE